MCLAGIRSLNLRNRRMNTGQSREETIANAKRRFQEISFVMKGLNEYHVDRAVQCYKLALVHGFCHGRKQAHVVAACFYIVCRQEKTMHMLIDFSDVLHTNVFALGHSFLKLVRLLKISVPLIDPSLYLARFAAALKFGEKTQEVTKDALRLIQRMKRDWIHYGRRPSGICGACLLIAARMHGFQPTQEEIVRVVRIGEDTIRKRLQEFAQTPSAALTIEEFRICDLQIEENPPCFNMKLRSKSLGVKQTAVTEAVDANGDEVEVDESEGDIKREMIRVLKGDDLKNVSFSKPNVPFMRTWEEEDCDEDPENWDDLSDADIDNNILTEKESQMKADIWEEMNRDWMVIQEAKLKREAELGLQHQQQMKKRERKPVKRVRIDATAPAAKKREVIVKKIAPVISKKINYAALDSLFA
jgi:transcription factor IIIB 90 kDa subunit